MAPSFVDLQHVLLEGHSPETLGHPVQLGIGVGQVQFLNHTFMDMPVPEHFLIVFCQVVADLKIGEVDGSILGVYNIQLCCRLILRCYKTERIDTKKNRTDQG